MVPSALILLGLFTVRAAEVHAPSVTSAPQIAASASAGPADPPAAKRMLTRHQLSVGLGFSHWSGNTFEAPIGLYIPGIVVGIQPGVSWLEARGRYAVSLVELSQLSGAKTHVGFASLALILSQELRVDQRRLMLGAGPHFGMVHTHAGVGLAVGIELVTRYLIDLGKFTSLGPFFEARAISFRLPGRNESFFESENNGTLVARHSDIQIEIGTVLTLW